MLIGTCIEAVKHPDADNLYCYRFQAGDRLLNIVANLTNVYQVGDQVNIVLAGETYEGTLIKERMVRGQLSHGMAVGKVA